MYHLRLGTSIQFADENFYRKLSRAKELGFDSVDFDIAGFSDDRAKEIENHKHLEEGLSAVRESGLFLNGVHISFSPYWNFAAPDEADRRASVGRTKEIFGRIDSFKPFCYIVHGSLEPIPERRRPDFIVSLERSLAELAVSTPRKVCVENLPRTCLLNTAEEACSITDKFPNIGICADLNHFLQETTESALLKLGRRVQTLHVSDCDYVNERHWLPGRGKIEWHKVLAALESFGYDGVFNYETVGAALEDIKENYDRLFASYEEWKNGGAGL